MYIKGVAPHPVPRALKPPSDVETNFQDEVESDNCQLTIVRSVLTILITSIQSDVYVCPC
jgi:hypothetical protein